jgi:Superfamily II DNA helicase
MCAKRPTNAEEFLEVNGVGENKLERYGETFIKAIAEFQTVD